MSTRTEPRLTSMGKALFLILVLSASLSCTSTGMHERQLPQEGNKLRAIGYSGMAKHGPASYLVVHDTKVYEDGPRIGLLKVTADSGTRYTSLAVTDWKDPDGRSNDLESACSLPGRAGEYLIAESGYWEGKYGRIFHVRVVGTRAEILRAYKLPLVADNNEQQEGDNFEGVACTTLDAERVLVILGERGGSILYPRGLLRWGTLDLRRESLNWHDGGKASIEVKSPGNWPVNARERDISGLYASADGVLWGVATADAGDNGPFRSVIYKLGRIINGTRPVDLVLRPATAWTIDGMKVESLAAPTKLVDGSVLSIGSEDENFGGVWRALYPMVAR